MTDFCSIDGRLTPLGEGLPGGVYLYQRLRTVDYRPLHTAAHLSRLRDGAGSLFGRPAELPAGRIADEIGALLRANGYPAGGATVTLRLYADGTYALTACRSIAPMPCEACVLRRRSFPAMATVLNGPRRHAAKRHGGRSRRPSGPVRAVRFFATATASSAGPATRRCSPCATT